MWMRSVHATPRYRCMCAAARADRPRPQTGCLHHVNNDRILRLRFCCWARWAQLFSWSTPLHHVYVNGRAVWLLRHISGQCWRKGRASKPRDVQQVYERITAMGGASFPFCFFCIKEGKKKRENKSWIKWFILVTLCNSIYCKINENGDYYYKE